MAKFYITTPIYYVNDRPHIGHAYTSTLADVLARYHRLFGDETYFLTGTDEHGQKVQAAAEKRGIPPQQHADEMVLPFQALWEKLAITHDDFIRTTEPRHTEIVQEILQDLYDRGEIYRGEYDGWYCVPDERFFTEKEVEDGVCPECGRRLNRITESNYFFRMSAYQDWLIGYIEQNPAFIQPDFRRNETLGFLRKPLQDLCISRPKRRLSWGIELPFDPDFVTYVWVDALVNYISAIGYRRDDDTFHARWPAQYHLIGKDIITTHTVYWPTLMKAMGVTMPETIFAHGWWLIDNVKMGKSLGNVVDPMDLVDVYGVDAFRYYVIAGMVLGQDANFTEALFVERFNAELANDLGNLLSRVLNLIYRNCDGRVPTGGENGPEEQALIAMAEGTLPRLEEAVRSMTLDKGIAEVIALVRETNRYLELRKPWVQAKAENLEPMRTSLYTAAESLRLVAGMMAPVMPERCGVLLRALGVGDPVTDLADWCVWGKLSPGSMVERVPPLFPRIQKETSLTEQSMDQKEEENVNLESDPLISVDEFSHVELRTAKILVAEKVEGTAKLLRLEVMMGEERRQLVAGVALYYEPDELIGMTVVVVANLKPAKIRGIESQGMVLAASKGETLKLITTDGELSSGAQVQ